MAKNLISLLLAPLFLAGCVSYGRKNIALTNLPSLGPLPQFKTSAHYTLEMERDLGANEEDFNKIEMFLSNVEKRVKTKEVYTRNDAEQIMSVIHEENQKLFSKYEEGDIFYYALRTGKADCERFTIPYLSAAEKLNLPIKAVLATGQKRPSHVFIRWKFPSEGESWLNWECIDGKPKPNDYCEDYPNLSEIPNFARWCIETRLDWCYRQYGTNYHSANEKAGYYLIKLKK